VPERARPCPALPHVVPSNLRRTNVPMPPLWTRARPWGLHLAFSHTPRAGVLQLHVQATRRAAAMTASRWLRVHARPGRQGAELRQARRRFPRRPRDLAPGSPSAHRTGLLRSRARHGRRPVPHLHGRHLDAPPSKGTVSPTPFLHVLTTPLEPAKPLAHLDGPPTRRSRGSGGPRSTLPQFSIARAPPDARNDKNRTTGEPTPLPRPFPAKFGLLLAGFRPSSSLSAVWTTLRGLRSFQGLERKIQGPVRKKSVFRSRVSRLNL
jgi:hypothetical protein